MYTQWHSIELELPNSDEMTYRSYVGDYQDKSKRWVSDRVLAVDANGDMRIGAFHLSGQEHVYRGRAEATRYDRGGVGYWEFHAEFDTSEMLTCKPFEPVFWAELPSAP